MSRLFIFSLVVLVVNGLGSLSFAAGTNGDQSTAIQELSALFPNGNCRAFEGSTEEGTAAFIIREGKSSDGENFFSITLWTMNGTRDTRGVHFQLGDGVALADRLESETRITYKSSRGDRLMTEQSAAGVVLELSNERASIRIAHPRSHSRYGNYPIGCTP